MAKAVIATIETICQTIQGYYPDANLELVRKAHAFAEKAHTGQMRSSGDEYIIHPTEVAQILAEMRLDLSSICAAFLHDTVEDTLVKLEDVEREFNKDVANLVDGVTKLSKMTFRTTEEKQAENFRKMIIAMSKDIRVILVKLADRLSNMRSLQFLPPHKQKTIAQETLDIYAPIANRLGISRIKIELEDLCLRFLHQDVYYKLRELVQKSKNEREKYIEDFVSLILEKLEEYDVKAQVVGRAKHFYSIYKKMERRQVDFNELHDLVAFRIVVDNITECYKALGVIHAGFRPVPGRFKDYIAMPKANNYQSLHTTVIGPSGERTEIQIRTQEMHQVAERGIAAHWKYKEGRFDSATKDNVEWVSRLFEWQKDLLDPAEFLETVKVDLFSEDVFVFTPKGEVKQLPHGATPLDFAYAVHTDVGHRCVGAKVNGRIVSLKHRLKSGDAMEIITSPTQTPSKDWLKIVRSSRAKAKIRAFIKQRERDLAKEQGKEIFEKTLKGLDLSFPKLEKSGQIEAMLKDLSVRSLEEIYIGIGYGRFPLDQVIVRLIPKEELEAKQAKLRAEEDESFLKKAVKSASKKSESRNAVIVEGVDDVLVRFARCCNPVPGENIAGFITRGRGVTVHQSNCPRALDTDNERKIEVSWNKSLNMSIKRGVRIRVLSTDEPGLLALMSQTITGCGVNISSANIRTTKEKKAIALFEVEVANMDQLSKVISALESKKGVIAVERS
jgi:guanosine-3',5'-bis(diphosphate) 3'-pyrophosphohydrolase